MRHRAIPHLAKRGDVYHFRMAVPAHLRERFGRAEIKGSLGTRDPLTARTRCRRLSNWCEGLVERAAAVPDLSQDEINRLLRGYFETLVQQANDIHFMARQQPPGLDAYAELEGAKAAVQSLQHELATGPTSAATRSAARSLWDEDRYGWVRPGSDEFDRLCEGVTRAKREAARLLAAMLRGDVQQLAIQDPIFDGIDPQRLPDVNGGNGAAQAGRDTSLSALADKYCAYKQQAGEWQRRSYQESRRVLDWFIREAGEKTLISDIRQEHIREFRDLLLRLPPNFMKRQEYADLSLNEIADRAGNERLSPKTRHKYFSGLKAFFQWCVADGYVAQNPAGEIRLGLKGGGGRSNRSPFTTEQLQQLFDSPLYRGCKGPKRRKLPGNCLIRDGLFWLPLLGLFAGLRVGEVVQLLASDVREQHGVTYISISRDDAHGKSVKTANAVRCVPVHPELVEIGFLDHVASRAAVGRDVRLFEDIPLGPEHDRGHHGSKRCCRYINAFIPGREIVFHSLRHSFSDALRRARVEDSNQKALLGHSDGSVTGGYGSGYRAVELYEDIKRVSFDIDLTHLHQP